MAIPKKLVVIGDGACGKTCLLLTFANDKFPESYIPTVFENYVANLDFEVQPGVVKQIELALWDTAGQEDYAHIRPLSYADANVILICFSIDNKDSFENLEQKWIPEMEEFCEGVPYVIVGCKTDLRGNGNDDKFITAKQGQDLANKMGAFAYAECSAKTKDNLAHVFHVATAASFTKGAKSGGCCTIS